MRIALILLSILALVFIGSISWYLISQDWWWWIKKQWTNTNQILNTINASDYWHNQIKLEDQIKMLSGMVQELSQKNTPLPKNQTESKTQSGNTDISVIRLSGKFLSLIMPTITPSLTENHGIFDLHIFDIGVLYSTYEDPKFWLKMIATDISYDTFIKNIRATGTSVYSVNETKWFPFRSFYLNPPKSDALVRIVVEFESQSIAIEIPKTKFNTFKVLILWNSSSSPINSSGSTSGTSSLISPKNTKNTKKEVTPQIHL